MKRWADISDCSEYRLALGREADALTWMSSTVLFVLNNPSTADAQTDDPTVNRGWAYSQRWGYDRMVFCNVNPHRSTDPALAKIPPEEVLNTNDLVLQSWGARADFVVAAWGVKANKVLVERAVDVLLSVTKLHMLELSKDGTPKHPLYLKGSLVPLLWKKRR